MYVRPSWDEYFIGVARETAKRSPDEKTQVGCVIVDRNRRMVGGGYNGTPPGFDDWHFDWHGKDKLAYVIHAEANALLHANGGELADCTLYCTHSPCPECTKLIAACGIRRVVFETLYRMTDFALLAAFGIVCEAINECTVAAEEAVARSAERTKQSASEMAQGQWQNQEK